MSTRWPPAAWRRSAPATRTWAGSRSVGTTTTTTRFIARAPWPFPSRAGPPRPGLQAHGALELLDGAARLVLPGQEEAVGDAAESVVRGRPQRLLVGGPPRAACRERRDQRAQAQPRQREARPGGRRARVLARRVLVAPGAPKRPAAVGEHHRAARRVLGSAQEKGLVAAVIGRARERRRRHDDAHDGGERDGRAAASARPPAPRRGGGEGGPGREEIRVALGHGDVERHDVLAGMSAASAHAAANAEGGSRRRARAT